jgi:hypothetical protein
MNIANPEYKPFGRGLEYSSSYSQDSGAKSEDDSPLRRQIIKSPKKRIVILSEKEHKEKMENMERLLNESDLLDKKLKK